MIYAGGGLHGRNTRHPGSYLALRRSKSRGWQVLSLTWRRLFLIASWFRTGQGLEI